MVLAPVIWLVRAKGWRRWLLGLVYLVVMVAGGALLWREATLAKLPSIPEPFDIGTFVKHQVPEERNAWTYYRRAARMLPAQTIEQHVNQGTQVTWATATPGLRSFLGEQAGALAEWRKGTEQDEALLVPRVDWKLSTPAEGLIETALVGKLAVLEASRLRSEGKPAEAWGWIHASLRCSRHLGQNMPMLGRPQGYRLASAARNGAQEWLRDPAVNPQMIRQAMGDCLIAQRLEANPRDAVQLEYLAIRDGLQNEPEIASPLFEGSQDTADYMPLVRWAKLFAMHEPERSKRLAKIMFARWLSEVDRPPSERAPVTAPPVPEWSFYQTRPGTSPIGLPDGELQRWLEQPSVFVRTGLDAQFQLPWLDQDRDVPRKLALRLAQELYEREHGGKPPAKLGELLGQYYPADEPLPERMTAEDPALP